MGCPSWRRRLSQINKAAIKTGQPPVTTNYASLRDVVEMVNKQPPPPYPQIPPRKKNLIPDPGSDSDPGTSPTLSSTAISSVDADGLPVSSRIGKRTRSFSNASATTSKRLLLNPSAQIFKPAVASSSSSPSSFSSPPSLSPLASPFLPAHSVQGEEVAMELDNEPTPASNETSTSSSSERGNRTTALEAYHHSPSILADSPVETSTSTLVEQQSKPSLRPTPIVNFSPLNPLIIVSPDHVTPPSATEHPPPLEGDEIPVYTPFVLPPVEHPYANGRTYLIFDVSSYFYGSYLAVTNSTWQLRKRADRIRGDDGKFRGPTLEDRVKESVWRSVYLTLSEVNMQGVEIICVWDNQAVRTLAKWALGQVRRGRDQGPPGGGGEGEKWSKGPKPGFPPAPLEPGRAPQSEPYKFRPLNALAKLLHNLATHVTSPDEADTEIIRLTAQIFDSPTPAKVLFAGNDSDSDFELVTSAARWHVRPDRSRTTKEASRGAVYVVDHHALDQSDLWPAPGPQQLRQQQLSELFVGQDYIPGGLRGIGFSALATPVGQELLDIDPFGPPRDVAAVINSILPRIRPRIFPVPSPEDVDVFVSKLPLAINTMTAIWGSYPLYNFSSETLPSAPPASPASYKTRSTERLVDVPYKRNPQPRRPVGSRRTPFIPRDTKAGLKESSICPVQIRKLNTRYSDFCFEPPGPLPSDPDGKKFFAEILEKEDDDKEGEEGEVEDESDAEHDRCDLDEEGVGPKRGAGGTKSLDWPTGGSGTRDRKGKGKEIVEGDGELGETSESGLCDEWRKGVPKSTAMSDGAMSADEEEDEEDEEDDGLDVGYEGDETTISPVPPVPGPSTASGVDGKGKTTRKPTLKKALQNTTSRLFPVTSATRTLCRNFICPPLANPKAAPTIENPVRDVLDRMVLQLRHGTATIGACINEFIKNLIKSSESYTHHSFSRLATSSDVKKILYYIVSVLGAADKPGTEKQREDRKRVFETNTMGLDVHGESVDSREMRKNELNLVEESRGQDVYRLSMGEMKVEQSAQHIKATGGELALDAAVREALTTHHPLLLLEETGGYSSHTYWSTTISTITTAISVSRRTQLPADVRQICSRIIEDPQRWLLIIFHAATPSKLPFPDVFLGDIQNNLLYAQSRQRREKIVNAMVSVVMDSPLFSNPSTLGWDDLSIPGSGKLRVALDGVINGVLSEIEFAAVKRVVGQAVASLLVVLRDAVRMVARDGQKTDEEKLGALDRLNTLSLRKLIGGEKDVEKEDVSKESPGKKQSCKVEAGWACSFGAFLRNILDKPFSPTFKTEYVGIDIAVLVHSVLTYSKCSPVWLRWEQGLLDSVVQANADARILARVANDNDGWNLPTRLPVFDSGRAWRNVRDRSSSTMPLGTRIDTGESPTLEIAQEHLRSVAALADCLRVNLGTSSSTSKSFLAGIRPLLVDILFRTWKLPRDFLCLGRILSNGMALRFAGVRLTKAPYRKYESGEAWASFISLLKDDTSIFKHAYYARVSLREIEEYQWESKNCENGKIISVKRELLFDFNAVADGEQRSCGQLARRIGSSPLTRYINFNQTYRGGIPRALRRAEKDKGAGARLAFDAAHRRMAEIRGEEWTPDMTLDPVESFKALVTKTNSGAIDLGIVFPLFMFLATLDFDLLASLRWATEADLVRQQQQRTTLLRNNIGPFSLLSAKTTHIKIQKGKTTLELLVVADQPRLVGQGAHARRVARYRDRVVNGFLTAMGFKGRKVHLTSVATVIGLGDAFSRPKHGVRSAATAWPITRHLVKVSSDNRLPIEYPTLGEKYTSVICPDPRHPRHRLTKLKFKKDPKGKENVVETFRIKYDGGGEETRP
ncbi:hypothetical protein T439DRAFT_380393 [Meredithblackwellia eburnea MCA 4105]